jgi:hypothetical protein
MCSRSVMYRVINLCYGSVIHRVFNLNTTCGVVSLTDVCTLGKAVTFRAL